MSARQTAAQRKAHRATFQVHGAEEPQIIRPALRDWSLVGEPSPPVEIFRFLDPGSAVIVARSPH